MKILTLHSDYINIEVKKQAIKNAEELKENQKLQKFNECLVVFSSVEKKDEGKEKDVAKNCINNIKDISEKVKTKNIILYPYVHLTNEPSNSKTAIKVMDFVKERLKKDGFNVHRAAFGWYKAFEIKVKGHPLSELSKEFSSDVSSSSDETESLKKERKLTSEWHILTEDGKLHSIDKFNYKGYENLKHFTLYEKTKNRDIKKEPPHIALMKKLELVDYEPASDSGNLRFYPKGKLIKKLLEEYITDRVVEYGGVEVETPIMYDMAHPTLSKYLQRFPARQYQIESDKRTFFLRFAACFGQFLMAHDATISYKNLPLRLYELARYAFRREQSGELCGLRRLRAFTMPDVHAMVADLKQAIPEYKKRFDLSLDVLNGIGINKNEIEFALRTTKEFFKENKKFLVELVKKFGKPALLELWDEKIFYFILKYEFNYIDEMKKASALSTDQIDIENGERYDINFVDKDGKKKHPLILHCSPSGAIERVMWALLEKAALEQKQGKVASLPLWLNPTQVRIIPVSGEYIDYATKITDELRANNIRADIDDRELHVGKKIRQAGIEWCANMVVIGEKEVKSKKLPIRIRGKRDLIEITTKQLIENIHKETQGKPFKPLSLPKELSKRIIFVG